MLATAAELADGISLNHIHRDFLAQHVSAVRETAAKFGNDIQIAYSGTLVTTDAELEHVREHMTYRLVDSPSHVKEAIGLSPGDSTAIREAMSEGLSAASRLVKDEWVLPFVVHGSSKDCAKQIAELCSKNNFCEFTVPITDFDKAEETMEMASQIARLCENLL